MTREDINKYAEKCADENMEVPVDYPFYPDDYESYKEAYIKTFKDGVEYADSHPKSPWISVKDDLPCNHRELTHKDYTLEVLTLDNYNIYRVVRMWEFDGKWIWGLDDLPVTHWMRLPELPKE